MSEVTVLNAIRAQRENDNALLTPAECLEDAASELRSGSRAATSALVLTLNEENGGYSVGWYASKLKASEMIALMEVAKTILLQDMGFIPEG